MTFFQALDISTDVGFCTVGSVCTVIPMCVPGNGMPADLTAYSGRGFAYSVCDGAERGSFV